MSDISYVVEQYGSRFKVRSWYGYDTYIKVGFAESYEAAHDLAAKHEEQIKQQIRWARGMDERIREAGH